MSLELISQTSTTQERLMFRSRCEKNRLNYIMDIMKGIDMLEIYLSLTNEDLGLQDYENEPLVDTEFPYYKFVCKADQNHIDNLTMDMCFPFELDFTPHHGATILALERRMLQFSFHFYRFCHTKREDMIRAKAVRLLDKCIDVFEDRGNDFARQLGSWPRSMGFSEDQWTMCRRYSTSLYNLPVWDIAYKDKYPDLLGPKSETADGVSPENVSSALQRFWKIYFTLIDNINHPTTPLRELTVEPVVVDPEPTFYREIRAYWWQHGIWI